MQANGSGVPVDGRAEKVARRIRRTLTFLMVAILVISTLLWTLTLERLPSEVRIASGVPGGLYARVGGVLKAHFDQRKGHRGTVIPTDGTTENLERLKNRSAELAIIQTGGPLPKDVAALAPLYPDVVVVVARKELRISSPADLRGRPIAVGLPGSGMRRVAVEILGQYGFAADASEFRSSYFTELLSDPGLQAAVITTGVLNADLQGMLSTGSFQVVPLREAEALCLRHPHLQPYTIPRGMFRANPPLPAERVETVAATAVLVARKDAGAELVTGALKALYEEGGLVEIPLLIPLSEARLWTQLPIHPAARSYFEPLKGFDSLASVVQSLDSGKELLVAIFAGCYLIWERLRRIRDRAVGQELSAAKERLDRYLNATVQIERAQMGVWERERLIPFLEEVTRIKLEALESLTQEELRGGTQFLIFITQCASLIQKMQLKLEIGAVSRCEEAELARLAQAYLAGSEEPATEKPLESRRLNPAA